MICILFSLFLHQYTSFLRYLQLLWAYFHWCSSKITFFPSIFYRSLLVGILMILLIVPFSSRVLRVSEWFFIRIYPISLIIAPDFRSSLLFHSISLRSFLKRFLGEELYDLNVFQICKLNISNPFLGNMGPHRLSSAFRLHVNPLKCTLSI